MGLTSYEMPLFDVSMEEREKMLGVLASILRAREQVRFAYAFGSFLSSRPYHDIDVAVYFGSTLEVGANLEAAFTLAADLEVALRKAGYRPGPLDVRPLNHAPLSFRYHVFTGRLLCSRDEALRVSVVAQTFSQYLDLLPLRRQAVKEAMRAWA
jgi:predicted nucleotidyltransferase